MTAINLTDTFIVTPGEEGQGTLFVTDARMILRPASGRQYHQVRHDTARAYEILNVANDYGNYNTHLITNLSPADAHMMLDRMFYAYVDGCCLELWCNAIVYYLHQNGETSFTREYGFDDGEYSMRFYVYCDVSDPETHLQSLLRNMYGGARVVIVRPDRSEAGYTAVGYSLPDIVEDYISEYT